MTSRKKQNTSKNLLRSRLIRRAKHWFVPHRGNKYHPHIIRWQGLAVTALVSLTTHVMYGYVTTGQFAVLGKSVTISTSELQILTNQARSRSGIAPLEIDSKLNQAATKKAEDMIANNYWSHESPQGVSPWHWIEQSGYAYEVAGENLAKNYSDAESVMQAWMSSATHKENIMNPRYTSVGFAVVEGVINAKINTIVVAYYAAPITAQASVKGASIDYSQAAVVTSFNNPLIYLGGLIKNLSPVTLGVLSGMILMIVVASAAHLSREYLPANIKKSWKKHHGLYKAIGLTVVASMILIGSSGSYL